jgi:hypothetical protein
MSQGDESGQHDRLISGDRVRPQARLAETVCCNGLSRPKGRPAEENVSGQPVEQAGVFWCDAERDKRRLTVDPRLLERARYFGQVAEPVGQSDRLVAVGGYCVAERKDRGCARREPDPAAQAENRVEDRPDGSRQGSSRIQSGGAGRGTAPAQNLARSVSYSTAPTAVSALSWAGQEVQGPDRFLIPRARPPAAQQSWGRGQVLGLEKKLGERRMGLIGAATIEGHLSVAGHVQRAGQDAVIRQRDPPNLGIRVGCDRDLIAHFDIRIATLKTARSEPSIAS